MSTQFKRGPAPRGDAENRAGCSDRPGFNITSRCELEGLARSLHSCGPRAIYELLAALPRGRDFHERVEDFARLHPATYARALACLAGGGRA